MMSLNQLGTVASLEFSAAINARLESVRLTNPLVHVKKSWIDGADEGLFARKSIKRGEVITCYVGEKLPTKVAIKRKDKSYLMRLGRDLYVDSLPCPHSLARFINDCITPTVHNVVFLKSPVEGCAWVVAIRDIQKDEEFFVNYGKWYWAMLKPTRLSHFRHSQLVKSLSED